MCGIAGKVCLKGKTAVTEKEITRMTDAIAHRGPDDSGCFISPDKRLGLGHRRLSIVDLSPLGHQPMSYLDRYQIVFNGEIYNFLEKRAELEQAGYSFRSKTDTEVILALYDRYAERCVEQLRGMFAFAIYDSKEQTLFCARDRVGKKPFKYYFDGQTLLFASELKAILTQPEYQAEPDYTAIHHYLTLQYVPAPLTGFKDIHKLEPAHWLRLDLRSGKLTKERYWKLDYSKKLHLPEVEWQERILATLEESVRLRMIADVPLGAFLSGGIDSSAVVALMAKHSNRPVKTFSIGFEEEKFNELPYARMIAEKYNTDHTEFTVRPDAIELLPMLVRQYEEPYADSSALPSYYVSKLTREHVTVALNGDGGDENFAGYSRYSIQKFALAYDRFRLLHKGLALPTSLAIAHLVKNTLTDRARRFAETLAEEYAHRYVNYICYFSNQAKASLYGATLSPLLPTDSYEVVAAQFREAGTSDRLDQTLYADFTTYLPDDLLVKVDIATMAVSLEGRSPFLDHELLELTAQIPFNLKLKGRDNKKYILKQALESASLVPSEVMYRPKRGFSVPLEQWFRHELREFTYEHLLSGQLVSRKLIQPQALRDLLDTHVHTGISRASQIWALLTLELWLSTFF